MTTNGQMKVADLVTESKFANVLNIDYFNDMQSIIAGDIYESNVNMVVSAPTGSGKTIVMELAILRAASKAVNPNDVKIIYVAPNKALCQQKVAEWTASFGSLNMTVAEITGDIDNSKCMQYLAKASIIVTTPEKWDSVTRSWRQHVFLLGRIDLLLLDEVQHITEDRGATLETIVVRMRTLNNAYQAKLKPGAERRRMRIIAISATLPNIQDIGEWLQCDKKAVHNFDNTFRPLPLTVRTMSYGSGNNAFLFERGLDRHVSGLIQQYSQGKQTLIFCSSKKGTETLAANLVGQIGHQQYLAQRQRTANSAGMQGIPQVRDPKLSGLLRAGVAYHHGGLPADDRVVVEQEYLRGAVQVLVATSTLAYGVNLPAHLVIIKGTNQWRGGSAGYEKLSKSTVIQMIGRAGRVGFDSSGVAVIMTTAEDRAHYDMDAMEMETVESTLPAILIEVLCAEITQTVVTSAAEAVTWIKSTFYYTRLKKNPRAYGFGKARSVKELEELLMAQCIGTLQKLVDAAIVGISFPADQSEGTGTETTVTLQQQNPVLGIGAAVGERSSGRKVTPSSLLVPHTEAFIMTRNMIKFKTMQLLMQLPPDCTMQKLLEGLSKAEELHKPVRKDDKKVLNGFNNTSDMLRYNNKSVTTEGCAMPANKIKLVQEGWHKCYILVQAAIARIAITDFSLRLEQSEIVDSLVRILHALKQYCIDKTDSSVIVDANSAEKRNANCGGKLLLLTRLLLRAVTHRAWDEYQASCGGILAHCVAPGGGSAALAASTKNYLFQSLKIRNVTDILRVFGSGAAPRAGAGGSAGEDINRIQSAAHCSISEASTLQKFALFCRKYALVVVTTLEDSSSSGGRGGQLRVRFSIRSQGEVGTGAASAAGLVVPAYALIAYSIPTQALICHRDLPVGTTTASKLEYVINYDPSGSSIFSHYNNDKLGLLLRDIQVCLVCTNLSGFDHNISPALINSNATTYNYIPREGGSVVEDEVEKASVRAPPQSGATKRNKKQRSAPVAEASTAPTPPDRSAPSSGCAEGQEDSFRTYFSLRHSTLPAQVVAPGSQPYPPRAVEEDSVRQVPPNCIAPQESTVFTQRWPGQDTQQPSQGNRGSESTGFLQLSDDDDEGTEILSPAPVPMQQTERVPARPQKSVSFATPSAQAPMWSSNSSSSASPSTHMPSNSFASAPTPAHLSRLRTKAQEMNLDLICPIQRFRPRALAAPNPLTAPTEAPLPTLYSTDINSLARSTELLKHKSSAGSGSFVHNARAPPTLPLHTHTEQLELGQAQAPAPLGGNFFLKSHNTDSIANGGSFFSNDSWNHPSAAPAAIPADNSKTMPNSSWQAPGLTHTQCMGQSIRAPEQSHPSLYITPPSHPLGRNLPVSHSPPPAATGDPGTVQMGRPPAVGTEGSVRASSSTHRRALAFDDLFF